jgi:aquaporin Z
MWKSWKQHWPEYVIEAWCLGTFMLSACAFAALLGYPNSPLASSIRSPFQSRLLMGCAMGLTAFSLIYSPWGKRSGAHMNPAVTFTFWRLGKVASSDAVAYVLAQFAGAILGVLTAWILFGAWVADFAVNFAVTIPGTAGVAAAFVAELLLSFILMSVILTVSNSGPLAKYTGLFAAGLVALFILAEAPISGMSMNPARTYGSAVFARLWTDIWIYFLAPPIGMLLASEAYVRLRGAGSVLCAKLHHHNSQRCIFRCGYAGRAATPADDVTKPAVPATIR